MNRQSTQFGMREMFLAISLIGLLCGLLATGMHFLAYFYVVALAAGAMMVDVVCSRW